MDALRTLVLPKFDPVKKSGNGFMVKCPVHDDGSASLSLSVGQEHPVVMFCHAGCTSQDILAAIGLTWEDITKPREQVDDRFTQPRRSGRAYTAGSYVGQYDYTDEAGQLLYQVLRTADKKFRQRRPDPDKPGDWLWSLGNTRRVPYRLPELIEAVKKGEVVYLAEGEKDVENLRKQGFAASCNSGGAGKWLPEFAEHLREAVVIICADKDTPGQAHARQVRDSLLAVDATVEIVEGKVGKDVSDHLAAGLGLEEMEITWTNDAPEKVDLAPDLWEFLATEDPPYQWIVEDLIERGDRLMLTGYEGLGKSQLARQMAVTMAGGVHPFLHHKSIPPVRVLIIDCENSERQSRRKFRQIATVSTKYGSEPAPGMLRLIHKPKGIDLTKPDTAEWLMERVAAHKPDVLFIGPFYRLTNLDIREETAARQVVAILDAARVEADCALIIEAHAGHGEQGKGRSVRPVGSSLLLRWPEFGFGIAPSQDPPPGKPVMDVEIRHWRGQRDIRQWPSYLTWGDPGDWPWKPSLGPTKHGMPVK